eukprot:GDKJ01020093.1.p1 GENE.GDKJ01020093.1~~GDKJ01020093.1.p1  ORF type:complete len:440 (-),score=21.58 GDKJ01020093.1:200-1489(-)
MNKYSFALSSGVTPVESDIFGGTSKRLDSVKVTPMGSTHLESTIGTCNTFLSTVASMSASDVSSIQNCAELTDTLNMPITSPMVGRGHGRADTEPFFQEKLNLMYDSPDDSIADAIQTEMEVYAEVLDISYPPMPVMASRIGSSFNKTSSSNENTSSSLPSPQSHTIDAPVDLPTLLAFQQPEIPSPATGTMSTTHKHTITRRIENTIIRNAIIHRCTVKNCHITNCQLTDSKCEGGFISTCKMVNTKLKNIPLITSSLLDRCLVKSSKLTNTIMRQGAVKGCRVTDSNLKQVGAFYSRLTRTHLVQCEYDFDEQLDCGFDECRRDGDPEQYFGAKSHTKDVKINISPGASVNRPNQQQAAKLADVLQTFKDHTTKQDDKHHRSDQNLTPRRESKAPTATAPTPANPKPPVPTHQTPPKVRSDGCCTIQ